MKFGSFWIQVSCSDTPSSRLTKSMKMEPVFRQYHWGGLYFVQVIKYFCFSSGPIQHSFALPNISNKAPLCPAQIPPTECNVTVYLTIAAWRGTILLPNIYILLIGTIFNLIGISDAEEFSMEECNN